MSITIETIEITKQGHPAMWESGGGYTNTGRATIITSAQGKKLQAVYTRRSGMLACENHALFVVDHNHVIIMVSHHRADFRIKIYQIVGLDLHSKKASLALRNEYSMGEWDIAPPATLNDAIAAAKDKALCYHCRSPHFIQEEEA